VTRCHRTLIRDGAVDGFNYASGDNICLDGIKLVPVSQDEVPLPADLVVPAGLTANAVFALEDSTANTRVVRLVHSISGVVRAWVALHPDKLYRWYGESDDSRVVAQRWSTGTVETVGWLLSGEEQRQNRVDYAYLEDETNCSAAHPEHCDPLTSTGVYQAGRYLDTVTYTRWTGSPSGLYGGASQLRRVKLHWQFSSFAWSQRDSWINGIRLRYTGRLDSIEVFGPTNDKARTYKLTTIASSRTRRDLLASVTVCDRDDKCLPPTRFDYSTQDPSAGSVASFEYAYEFPLGFDNQPGADPSMVMVADVTNDGNDDVIYLNDPPPMRRPGPARCQLSGSVAITSRCGASSGTV
jgi:hypothetical protein